MYKKYIYIKIIRIEMRYQDLGGFKLSHKYFYKYLWSVKKLVLKFR